MLFTQKARRLLKVLLYILLPKRNNQKWLKRTKDESKKGYLSQFSSRQNKLIWESVTLLPGDVVLEVGSNCGNRFLQKASQYPNVTFVGIDINEKAIELGIETAQSMGLKNVFFYAISAENLNTLEKYYPEGFNVIYTWATLIYIHPIHIRNVLLQIISAAKRELVIIEQHSNRLRYWPFYLGVPIGGGPNIVRNYRLLISSVVRKMEKTVIITATEVPHEFWNPGGGKGTKFLVKMVD